MNLRVGTSGYSYPEWKGTFYPEDLPAKDMLRFYGGKLPAVEINNTFYRMPTASVLQGWAEQVPASFKFALKASRRISHVKRLKDAGEEMEYLLRTAKSLEERLGVILYQLPPYQRKDVERLESFLELLVGGPRAAFEFRHASWFDDDVFGALRRKDCALCVADTGEDDATPFVSTAGWGYLRLRRPEYTDAELDDWAKKTSSQQWSDAFVFFKHEDEGVGPALAARFLERARC
ncbi:MAG: DUF72 domain-containing protein [bacterium]